MEPAYYPWDRQRSPYEQPAATFGRQTQAPLGIPRKQPNQQPSMSLPTGITPGVPAPTPKRSLMSSLLGQQSAGGVGIPSMPQLGVNTGNTYASNGGIPTDSQAYQQAMSNRATRSSLGQPQWGADPMNTMRVTAGGLPQLNENGRPTAEDLGFASNTYDARRARAEQKYGKLPLDQLVAMQNQQVAGPVAGIRSRPAGYDAEGNRQSGAMMTSRDPVTGITTKTPLLNGEGRPMQQREGSYADPMASARLYNAILGRSPDIQERLAPVSLDTFGTPLDAGGNPLSPKQMAGLLGQAKYQDSLRKKQEGWGRIIMNRQAQNAGFKNAYQAGLFERLAGLDPQMGAQIDPRFARMAGAAPPDNRKAMFDRIMAKNKDNPQKAAEELALAGANRQDIQGYGITPMEQLEARGNLTGPTLYDRIMEGLPMTSIPGAAPFMNWLDPTWRDRKAAREKARERLPNYAAEIRQ